MMGPMGSTTCSDPRYYQMDGPRSDKACIPSGKRVALDSPFLCVPSDGSPLNLTVSSQLDPHLLSGVARLRVTCGLDMRENREIAVFLAGETTLLGVFDLRFAYALQPFEMLLEEKAAKAALRLGITLQMVKGEENTILLTGMEEPFLNPHVIFDKDFLNHEWEFAKRLCSDACLQPFGWLEGCVLDGLCALPWEKQAKAAVSRHLNYYVRNNDLVYEDPRSSICDGTIYGIECGLPFAVMAREGGYEKPLRLFRNFVNFFGPGGTITDKEFLSAEGVYTVAYPLAVLACATEDDTMAQMAIRQLLVRRDGLVCGKDLYLRNDGGQMLYRNWGRAYVWYLLGLIKTILAFRKSGISYPKELEVAFRQVAEHAAPGMKDGLCSVFLHQEETGPDTSSTAGIAAAFALGYKAELIPEEYRQKALQACRTLLTYLTPDGMLTGCSQSNKNGETLQRSGYRVISQMAMGLMAHLIDGRGIQR